MPIDERAPIDGRCSGRCARGKQSGRQHTAYGSGGSDSGGAAEERAAIHVIDGDGVAAIIHGFLLPSRCPGSRLTAMRRSGFLFTILAALGALTGCHAAGQERPAPAGASLAQGTPTVAARFVPPPKPAWSQTENTRKPWVRWWWPGSAVDKENLTRQTGGARARRDRRRRDHADLRRAWVRERATSIF